MPAEFILILRAAGFARLIFCRRRRHARRRHAACAPPPPASDVAAPSASRRLFGTTILRLPSAAFARHAPPPFVLRVQATPTRRARVRASRVITFATPPPRYCRADVFRRRAAVSILYYDAPRLSRALMLLRSTRAFDYATIFSISRFAAVALPTRRPLAARQQRLF